MSWRQFCWEWLKRTFKQSIGTPQIVALLISIALGFFVPRVPGVHQVDFLSWLLPAVVLGTLLLFNFLRVPYLIYKPVADAVKPTLTLIFDPNNNDYRACRQYDEYRDDEFGNGILTTLRVAIVSTGVTTVDEAKVWLVDFTPQGAPFLPAELRFMHDDTFNSTLSKQGVTLYQNHPHFVVIASKRSVGNGSQEIWLHYASQNNPPRIPADTYTLRLRATARNAPSYEKQFRLWVEPSGRLFIS